MDYLFNNWKEICEKITQHTNKFLLCDYDGTLTPIAENPEDAQLGNDTRKILQELVKKRRLSVGFISGRSLTDVRAKIGIDGALYAGNHGFEIEGPGIKFIYPLTDEITSLMRLMTLVLRKALSNIKGVIIEDKGMTLSIHYRMVDEEKLPQLHTTFENTVEIARKIGKVKTFHGKKVHEIRPAIAWDKGKAVDLIISKHLTSSRKDRILAIYLGDDLTDEDAFKAVNARGGISIFVGDNRVNSAANYYLNSTSEVVTFLTELNKIV